MRVEIDGQRWVSGQEADRRAQHAVEEQATRVRAALGRSPYSAGPPPDREPGRRRWPAAVSGAWIFIAGVLVAAAFVPVADDRPRVVDTVTVGQLPPGAGTAADPSGAGTYSWEADPSADRYRVVFQRGSELVEELFVEQPTVDVALPPGTYMWYVFAIGPDGLERGLALVASEVTVG